MLRIPTIATATLTLALAAAAALPGAASASAPTHRTALRLPAEPQVSVRMLTFSGHPRRAPKLWALRDDVQSLPSNVTMLTGVKRSGNRWIGMVAMLRWQLQYGNTASAGGSNDLMVVHSDRSFRASAPVRVNDTGQGAQTYAGGHWIARVGRYASDGSDKGRGGPRALLGQVGNLLAGGANPRLLADVTGIEQTFTVEVNPTGNGSGNIDDNTGNIRCTLRDGVVGGTCSATFNVGTNIVLAANALAGSTQESWTGGCNGVQVSTACTVPAQAAGATFKAGAVFTKLNNLG